MLKEVRIFLQQLESPFGFLVKDANDMYKKSLAREASDIEEEKKGDHRYFEREKKLEAKFNVAAALLAKHAGFSDHQNIPWALAT